MRELSARKKYIRLNAKGDEKIPVDVEQLWQRDLYYTLPCASEGKTKVDSAQTFQGIKTKLCVMCLTSDR